MQFVPGQGEVPKERRGRAKCDGAVKWRGRDLRHGLCIHRGLLHRTMGGRPVNNTNSGLAALRVNAIVTGGGLSTIQLAKLNSNENARKCVPQGGIERVKNKRGRGRTICFRRSLFGLKLYLFLGSETESGQGMAGRMWSWTY